MEAPGINICEAMHVMVVTANFPCGPQISLAMFEMRQSTGLGGIEWSNGGQYPNDRLTHGTSRA